MPDVASGCAVQTVVAVFSDEVAEFVVEVLVAATLVYYAKGRLKTRYDFRRPFYRFVYILLLKLFQFFFTKADLTFTSHLSSRQTVSSRKMGLPFSSLLALTCSAGRSSPRLIGFHDR